MVYRELSFLWLVSVLPKLKALFWTRCRTCKRHKTCLNNRRCFSALHTLNAPTGFVFPSTPWIVCYLSQCSQWIIKLLEPVHPRQTSHFWLNQLKVSSVILHAVPNQKHPPTPLKISIFILVSLKQPFRHTAQCDLRAGRVGVWPWAQMLKRRDSWFSFMMFYVDAHGANRLRFPSDGDDCSVHIPSIWQLY